jgi:uncharacterized protein (UPF0179 family)
MTGYISGYPFQTKRSCFVLAQGLEYKVNSVTRINEQVAIVFIGYIISLAV